MLIRKFRILGADMPKKNISDTLFFIAKNLILVFLTIIILYPFLHVIATSLSGPTPIIKNEVTFFPRDFTFDNYKKLYDRMDLDRALFNTLAKIFLGLVSGLIMNSMAAYILTIKKFIFRKHLNILYVITMYISGCLVPTFMVYNKLGLVNSFHVYWIPIGVVPYYMFIIKSYIIGIPKEILEAARIEGASENRIYWKIILPLIKPVIASIALFIIVDQWNAWFDTVYFAPKQELTTLQYEFQKIISLSKGVDPPFTIPTVKTILSAMAVILSLPMILIYTIFQKHLFKGLTIGSIVG